MWVALATAGVVVVAFVFLGCAGFDLVVAALAAVVAMGVVVVTVVVLVVAVVDVVVMVDEVVLVVTLVVVAVVVAVEVEVEVEVVVAEVVVTQARPACRQHQTFLDGDHPSCQCEYPMSQL
mmetsp:Transcript_104704/g.273342  ORF Transcript_104704/g.273342 Transcript_104704/m.273342 type:complete len:121 (-) Transcript_104704:120-482(-)